MRAPGLIDTRVVDEAVSALSLRLNYSYRVSRPAVVFFESTVPAYAAISAHVFTLYLSRRLDGRVDIAEPDQLLLALAERVSSRLAAAALTAAAYNSIGRLARDGTVVAAYGLYTRLSGLTGAAATPQLLYAISREEVGTPTLIVVADDHCTTSRSTDCREHRDALRAILEHADTQVVTVDVYGWHDIHKPAQKAITSLIRTGHLSAHPRH